MKTIKNIYNKYLGKIRRSLSGRGILNTIMLIPRRYFFRFQFRKFDFWGKIEPHEMDGPEEVKKHATKYEASNHTFFKKLFDNLEWRFQNSTFVDFGCGKGASLVYASELGFKKIIGIEFSSKLAKTAVDNMQKLSDQKGGKVNFEISNIDAAQYEIPSDADCFYFFNPFDSFILDKVLQNITRSLETKHRKILIVYLNAIHNEVIERYQFKKVKYLSPDELDIYYFGGAYVYTNV
ncbi:MAG: class I SAM-dependent methyltransferase [Bacteroidia bacterium]|nr:class I SAM-dependent methyltransferase [Bacteroidia bacterium]